MKKKNILFLIIFIVLLDVGFLLYFINSVGFDSKDEIINLFKNKKVIFTNSASALTDSDGFWSIREKTYGTELRSDWEDIIIAGGIHIVIHDKETENVLAMKKIVEGNDAIKEIISSMRFKIITHNPSVDEGCIYYIKQTRRGYESGIVYCPIDNEIQNPYLITLIPIASDWYYYEAK